MNSKQKGNRWELEFAKILGEAFGEEFRRVPQSGAIFGGANRHRAIGVREDAQEILSGDLITPKGFPYSVECKNYKDLEFHQIYQGKCATLDEWIRQGEEDAEFANKIMLLSIKLSRKGTYICLPLEVLKDANFSNFMIYKDKYIIADMKVVLDYINKL